MTVRASLYIRLVGACLALVVAGATAGLSAARAQTPAPRQAPAPRQSPAADPPPEDAPARETEADAPAPRPARGPRAPAPDAGVIAREEAPVASEPVASDGSPDGEPTEPSTDVEPSAAADAEAAAADEQSDAAEPRTPPAPLSAPPPAANPSDAGVPSEAPLDAGMPDLGVPEPVVVVAVDAGTPAPVEEAPAPPPASSTTFVQIPVPFIAPGETTDWWEGVREVIPVIPTGGIAPPGLLALLALLAVLSSAIERLRARLLRDGWLPALLSFVQVAARLLALLIALALVIQVVPANVRWVVYFILMASGAALGWSMRDVMPDLIAGVVIVFERRIRRGMWIRSEEFSGAVERIGLRSSWLRDSKGHRVAVPNRMLMQIPIVSDEEGDTVQEVVLRLGSKGNAADIRRALRDAVLASPWTTPRCEPQVLRDPMDPELWQVRGRLLSASFASAFQGQLLERAEAHLAALESRAARAREAAPVEEGANVSPATAKHPKLDKGEKPDKPPEKPPKMPS